MRKLLVTAFVLLASVLTAAAESAEKVEMADALRGSGKIYVVVAVISVILLSLIVYIFSIDRRLKKIENRD